MSMLTLKDLDVKGKKVLLRVDFNVPLDANHQVTDNTRIVSSLPTIRHLLKDGARVILISHLGRPKGNPSEEFSLRPVAEELGKLLDQQVHFSPALLGPVAQSAIECLENGDCLLMENVRFYPEEEKNDVQFAKELASFADIFVNDAFGTAHRAHASNVGVTQFFDQVACGLLIEKELTYLKELMEKPKSPFTAILGGAKVKDKISVIENLLEKADRILIGGGMAYSFLAVKDKTVGNSILDEGSFPLVKRTLEKAESLEKPIYLPLDHIVATEFKNDAPYKTVEDQIPDGFIGMDIGPKTVESFVDIINDSQTVFWNGPMGVFEMSRFQQGTMDIARAMADSEAITVVGGGDSVAAVNQLKLNESMTLISTGGGASLELLEGKTLPGIAALEEKYNHGA